MFAVALALAQSIDLPPVPREFRAAWVATVDNIDWPSTRILSSDLQQAEMIRILDRAKTLKLNAIIFQVRPAADALYESKLEPWSEYLTNRQGKAPSPKYDPLAFVVKEAHNRGIEVHCWFNPYRAKHPSAKGPLATSHIAKQHPKVVRSYGKLLWMDPGEPFVQDRSLNVIKDVVRRYDVDGIHIDDYFYPYPEKGIAFPDESSFKAHGGSLSLVDWRRQNVDHFVKEMYQQVHAIKPWVKVGISPFGIYRSGVPEGIKSGVDQYAELYADPLKWLQLGWCDYLAPQLYWPIRQKAQSFPVLLDWWRSKNDLGRHIWPGLYTSRTLPEEKATYHPNEVVEQIETVRKGSEDAGEIHFSMKALMVNPQGVADAIAGRAYAEDALPPATKWLSKGTIEAPTLTLSGNRLSWTSAQGVQPFWYVVWLRYGTGKWMVRVLPGLQTTLQPEASLPDGALTYIAVASVDRCGVMSEPARQGVSGG